jgi:hypothetical protein
MNLAGQKLFLHDTLAPFHLANISGSEDSLVRWRFSHDLEYAVFCTSIVFLNWQQGSNAGYVSFWHHVNYRSQVAGNRKIRISNSFSHDLGGQYFYDSIARFQPDENILETRFGVRIMKNLDVSVISMLSTRFFNAYGFMTDDAGNLVKSLVASFMTPLRWTCSPGFGLTLPELGTLTLGLSAARLTLVLNRKVYAQQGMSAFYGVPRSRMYLFEFGLSMHLLIEKVVLDRVRWNLDLLIFKNYHRPVDVAMKNVFAIRINKFLKASLQTRIYYEKEVSLHIQVEHLVSMGFFICL